MIVILMYPIIAYQKNITLAVLEMRDIIWAIGVNSYICVFI